MTKNPMDTLSQDVIGAIAAMQEQAPDSRRSAELATEVGRLNGAVRRASSLTAFANEPVHFFCALERGSR
jgi:hypothetical protein